MAMKPEWMTRAMAAYFRSAKPGESLAQPSNTSSGEQQHDGKWYVVLRNGGGVLAVYRVRNDDMLKRLKRWPAEIN